MAGADQFPQDDFRHLPGGGLYEITISGLLALVCTVGHAAWSLLGLTYSMPSTRIPCFESWCRLGVRFIVQPSLCPHLLAIGAHVIFRSGGKFLSYEIKAARALAIPK